MVPKRMCKAWLCMSALFCALTSTAHAGPVELLNAATFSPNDGQNVTLSYNYGGNGIFVSSDGGTTLKWLCSLGIATSASNRSFTTFASGDGSIYLGMFDGVLKGDANGCGFTPMPEMDKKWVRAFASDPFDTKKTYLVTTTGGMAENGLYLNDGSGAFAQVGATVPKFIGSLHIVKNGEARRFYETGVFTNLETNKIDYSVRVSDDDGMTWTEEAFDPAPFDTMMTGVNAEFTIVAVDPANPDNIVARLVRSAMAPDDVLLSREKGKAGSWEKIGEVVQLGGVAFTADGALFFGEDNFANKGLYKIAKLGEEAQKISETYRFSCLAYDTANDRLFGCADNYRFGTLDTSSGELTTMLDMRCTEHNVECPGQDPEPQTACAPTTTVEFCNVDHWLLAPMCCQWERAELEFFAASQTITCEGGTAVAKPEGRMGVTLEEICPGSAFPTGGTRGSAGDGAGGMSSAAGSSSAEAGRPAAGGTGSGSTAGRGGDSAAGSGSNSSSGGCSCTSVGSSRPTGAALLALSIGLFALSARRSRRRRYARQPRTTR
jgi:hypothetical protein